jgi:hypothetical protein
MIDDTWGEANQTGFPSMVGCEVTLNNTSLRLRTCKNRRFELMFPWVEHFAGLIGERLRTELMRISTHNNHSWIVSADNEEKFQLGHSGGFIYEKVSANQWVAAKARHRSSVKKMFEERITVIMKC